MCILMSIELFALTLVMLLHHFVQSVTGISHYKYHISVHTFICPLYTLCLKKKVPTFKLSVTLSNLN